MRAFDDELSAVEYAIQLVEDGEFEGRIYALSESNKPKLIGQYRENDRTGQIERIK
jgi:hypothetical protein